MTVLPVQCVESVVNPGEANEQFSDSVLLNGRNIRSIELLEGDRATTMSEEQLGSQFSMGDQSRLD